MSDKPPLLVIAGPTGVGKTAAAVALAGRLPIEVVSADSRQVYRGMDVATGKPTDEERRTVRHHLVDIVDPDDRYDAARFARDARAAIGAIRERGRLPVVVGGTGLYIRALLRGLERAGSPAGQAQTRWRERVADWDVVYVGLTLDRARLDDRLRRRAQAMVDAGLEGEVRGLLARGYAPTLAAMQGLGYREFAGVVQGRLDAEEALRLMRRDTLRYARRQWTWFAREPELARIDVEAAEAAGGVAAVIEARLKQEGRIG